MPPIRSKLGVAGVSDALVRELRDVIARPAEHRVPTEPQPPQPTVTEPVSVLRPLDTFTRIREHAPAPSWPPQRRRAIELFSLIPWFIGAGAVIAGLLYVSTYGLRARGRVVEQGNAAIAHMLEAKQSVEQLDWRGAEEQFAQAGAQFDEASRQLGVLGPAITGLLSRIPGLSGLGTGRDIVNAGKLLSDAGVQVSDAVAALGRAGEAAPGAKDVEVSESLDILDTALSGAAEKLARAQELLANVQLDEVPDDLRPQFVSFRDRLPAIRELVEQGSSAVSFVRLFMGEDMPRRYLVLFQNSSELRPTGGFPGSYGLLTTEKGRVKDWRADDIYNPDGQIKELIVPPLQLQHITPGWGMRDANWFADFPTSARKVMEYWRRGGGEAVDGVVAIRPDVLAAVLKVIGPVALPQYGVELTSDNVLVSLQTEVEENRPTGKPKQIIADLAPVVLDRLATLSGDKLPAMLAELAAALDRKDVLMYFNEKRLQGFVDGHGWTGAIAEHTGDYLMVNISNIAGAKTDAVTDTAMKLESRLEQGTLVHRLTITRRHDGGTTPYGFYNKANKAYVRVLVPRGSTLRGIAGNDAPHHKPIADYSQATRDSDLQRLEETYRYDAARDLITYEESEKTGFGFWMRVEPGDVDQVQLEYAVPAAASSGQYRLLVQRQPGLDISDFEFTLDKPGLMVGQSSPAMVEWPDSWRLHTKLDRDVTIQTSLR